MIHLVLGGARSGKSDHAEALLVAQPGALRYLATGWVPERDDDMAARIARHRSRRDARFETIEAGAGLAPALREAEGVPVLVDALGTWVAAHPDFAVDIAGLLAALRARRELTVLVSEEVGLGVHPETATGRRFRDVLGEVNQAVAAQADAVTLVVAGLPLVLKSPSPAGGQP